ncbi:Spy/CpxP family protein refolding chaperone [Myxosarcina sp. GI1]|uniref:Spy/CpxP family protein refolding chaperone n=1 Tax=Myxosarcina sp. GI1 TaxID=1541065 RepID=UPI0020A12F94|nr:hypothetical protein [Myxosarcina sp. GI1]
MTALAQHPQDNHYNDLNSPYAEQLNSPVRGLNAEEVDNLLEGKGAGYARMAELNSYPGPRHVLDLRSQLNLSATQIEKIQKAFNQMQSEAKSLGQTIVAKEQELSEAFTTKKITNVQLHNKTNELARLYGKLRSIHLQAHLQITPLLSVEQIRKYDRIRGYEQDN